jgi:hypothetical protein
MFVQLAVVLLCALLPLPGAWFIVVVAPLLVWALGPDLPLIGVATDRAIGRVQPLACRASAGPRAPPAHLQRH